MNKIIPGIICLLIISFIILTIEVKAQGDPEWRTVTTKTQLIKSDSSAFSQYEAAINIVANDIADSTHWFPVTGDRVPPDGYVELTFNVFVQEPEPTGVVDIRQGFLPESYGISDAYPNPVKDRTRFDVSVPERVGAVLSLYDVIGKKIYSEGIELERAVSVLELSGVANLPPGVYFISIKGTNNNYLLSGKFVRMNSNNVYGGSLSKSSGVSDGGGYDFNVVGERPYIDPSPNQNKDLSKSESVDGEVISDKIGVQWIVPVLGSDARSRDLWLWNDSTGTYDFQSVIVDTFHLPYPTSSGINKSFQTGD